MLSVLRCEQCRLRCNRYNSYNLNPCEQDQAFDGIKTVLQETIGGYLYPPNRHVSDTGGLVEWGERVREGLGKRCPNKHKRASHTTNQFVLTGKLGQRHTKPARM